MYARITRIEDEGQWREVWQFILLGGGISRIYLERYTLEFRPTKRHKWRVEKIWDRCDKRSNTTGDPVLTEEIKNEARTLFAAQIREVEIML